MGLSPTGTPLHLEPGEGRFSTPVCGDGRGKGARTTGRYRTHGFLGLYTGSSTVVCGFFDRVAMEKQGSCANTTTTTGGEARDILKGTEDRIFELLCCGSTQEHLAEWLRPPLEHAVAAVDLALVKKLKRAGAKGSAVHLAAKGGQAGFVRDLLELGASPSEKDENGDTPLHIAAALGHNEVVSILVQRGAVADTLDSKGYSPLHLATESGSLASVNTLLAAPGVDVNLRYGIGGYGVLDLGALHGHVPIVQALIQNGADVKFAGFTGVTALHEAAICNQAVVIDVLVEAGGDVDVQTMEGETPLHVACKNRSPEAVLALLRHGADSNLLDHNLYSPLHHAAKNCNANVVNALLAAGAAVNLRSSRPDESSALKLAASVGNDDVVRALIHHGADVNDYSWGGHTAMGTAASCNEESVLNILIEAGAKLEFVDDMWSPIHWACRHGSLEVVLALLRHGVDAHRMNPLGHAAIHVAAWQGSVAVLDALLAAGANVNDTDADTQSSPLTSAVLGGQMGAVKALLKHGANVNYSDQSWFTPLKEAVCAKNFMVEIIQTLVLAGADVDDSDPNDRWTPLHHAASLGRFQAVRVLLHHGASTNMADAKGRSPIYLAGKKGHLSSVHALLESGAEFGTMSVDEDDEHILRSVLHAAARRGHVEVLKALAQHGAALNVIDVHGNSALVTALMFHQVAAVKALIDLGADVNGQNQKGHTALHLSCFGFCKGEMMLPLLEGGANVNARNHCGRTPLHMAAFEVDNTNCSSMYGGVEYLEARKRARTLLQWGADEKAVSDEGETASTIADEPMWRLISRAPADRCWRRRVWLILGRRFPYRARLEWDARRPPKKDEAGKRAKPARIGAGSGATVERVGGVTELPGEKGAGSLSHLVARVVGLREEDVFRLIIRFV